MYYLMPVVFILGIVAIILEDKIKVNKSATAVMMCIVLWLMLMFNGQDILVERQNAGFMQYAERAEISGLPDKEKITAYLTERAFIPHLGDVSQTLFFVMCTMLIVSTVDKHGGFLAVARFISTNNKRLLLWYLSIASFFFSALLDNLAAAIVLIAILRKLAPHATDRMKYACMIVIAANAGGSWSPVGDVTTLLLWTGGNISAWHQISHLFLPALVNLLLPLIVAHFWLFRKNVKLRENSEIVKEDEYAQHIPVRSRIVIFFIGILSLVMVPLFQAVTHLPAFMCVLIGMVFLWVYTDIMYGKLTEIRDSHKLRISKMLHTVDLATIFFFLGILMSVAALNTGGQLTLFADFLTGHFKEPYAISFIIGAASSLVDNVALVAATMGMYPVVEASAGVTSYLQFFVADGGFWTFLAYCAVTGGSFLIIGSATGVTVMGLEKVSFGYYLKRFTPLALLGYVAGAAVFLAMA
ncbi:MAG: sodium:proton antiporter NhaD [Bacteroidia bacterium]|nr:sodium:proton antiporter NhaD [Bacteroidia bacterium]